MSEQNYPDHKFEFSALKLATVILWLPQVTTYYCDYYRSPCHNRRLPHLNTYLRRGFNNVDSTQAWILCMDMSTQDRFNWNWSQIVPSINGYHHGLYVFWNVLLTPEHIKWVGKRTLTSCVYLNCINNEQYINTHTQTKSIAKSL